METENSCTDTARENLLGTASEKQDVAVEQLLDSHQLPDKKPKTACVFLGESEDMCKTWSTECSDNDNISSENPCAKNSMVSDGRSGPTTMQPGKHDLAHPRTCCRCRAKTSSCSEDHSCLVLQKDLQCRPPSQAVKRGYHSLVNESERFYRKRRPHSHSYFSEESVNPQNDPPEEGWGPPRASAPLRPRRRRRRKRSRLHARPEALELRENAGSPPTGSSSLGHQAESASEGKRRETEPPEAAAADRNAGRAGQAGSEPASRPGSPLPPRARGAAERPGGAAPRAAGPGAASAPAEEGLDRTSLERKESGETARLREEQTPPTVPAAEKASRRPRAQACFCRYELAEALPHGKANEAPAEWLRFRSGLLSSPPPLPFGDAHAGGHAFVATEQVLAPLAFPEQALLIPVESHDRLKGLPCDVYPHILPPGALARRLTLAFPFPAALAAPGAAPQPSPLRQPVCSTSATAARHTFRALQPRQQLLPPAPALTGAPLPRISVAPAAARLCPGPPPAFVASPQMPILPASVLHPGPLAFPPLPHALLPSLLSPHPAVIPLQPLF